MKQAILLALPGTSSEDAARTIEHIDGLFRDRFPLVRRMWTYTSSGVRRKLERRGKPAADPARAMTELRTEGITHLVVKSLHLASGVEYTELKDLTREFGAGPKGFDRIALSAPLMETPAEFERAMRCLLDELRAETGSGDALLLVAHGSRRPELQGAYEAAAALCRRLDPRAILSTLISKPSLEDAIRECKASGSERVVVAPLMIVAGLSTLNELAGPGPESWISALEREGIRCVPLVKGLGDRDGIVRIWMDDVERALAGL